MSVYIKCDGQDNCQNFDGCNDQIVLPLSAEAERHILNKHNDRVEHLCERCLSEYNEEEGALVWPKEKHKNIITLRVDAS